MNPSSHGYLVRNYQKSNLLPQLLNTWNNIDYFSVNFPSPIKNMLNNLVIVKVKKKNNKRSSCFPSSCPKVTIVAYCFLILRFNSGNLSIVWCSSRMSPAACPYIITWYVHYQDEDLWCLYIFKISKYGQSCICSHFAALTWYNMKR